jgi:hypothetical protein
MENWDQDIEWLKSKLPGTTPAQQDDFAERVAIMVADAKMTEYDARIEAMFCLGLKNE